MEEYPTGDIEQVLLIHGHNMEAAGICKQRHAALVKYLKEHQ